MAKDPYRYFRVEARELLEQLGRGVLDLEKGAGELQLVPRLLRLTHTLKGAARVVRQSEIADHAHAIEDALAPFRESTQGLRREHIDAVLGGLDRISAHMATLAPAPALAAETNTPAPMDGLYIARPDFAELDVLLDGIAQTHAQIAALRRHLGVMRRVNDMADLLADQLAPRRAGGEGRSADIATSASRSTVQELRELLGRFERGLASPMEQMDRELRQVRDTAEQLRLVPAATLFTSLERTARDVAHTLGKKVLFQGHGGGVRLDAEVLAAMQGPLLQTVRNAVAHGIETEGVRTAAGKPPEGRVTLDVARQGRRVVFRCSDDGAGVDLDAVRRAAQRKGWLATVTQDLDAQALLQLLLRGGLSTAAVVSEVSGRGVGLDLVREAVDRLGGEVSVCTASSQGTTLTLSVPLSLASLDALVVESDDAAVSIPLDAVRCTVRFDAQQIARTAQGDALLHEGEVMPFVPLSRVLRNTTRPSTARFGSAVIVEGAGGVAAIGVDRLLGTANIVLRALPESAMASPVVAGATLDVEGCPQIVLDPDGLVNEAQRAGASAPQVSAARVPVLVIDDSLTTRMLEQSILESAGYEVHSAMSAEEGLERAKRRRYALYLVDVEMPGMDGFSFVEQTRADPAMRDVPAMLVTSRSSVEDRQRGEDVGAQGYIVKSEFAQDDFLRAVRQLTQVAS
jgi:two-component system chemotaxis sensor kinase CheA